MQKTKAMIDPLADIHVVSRTTKTMTVAIPVESRGEMRTETMRWAMTKNRRILEVHHQIGLDDFAKSVTNTPRALTMTRAMETSTTPTITEKLRTSITVAVAATGNTVNATRTAIEIETETETERRIVTIGTGVATEIETEIGTEAIVTENEKTDTERRSVTASVGAIGMRSRITMTTRVYHGTSLGDTVRSRSRQVIVKRRRMGDLVVTRAQRAHLRRQ
jgi:hypothetical protein